MKLVINKCFGGFGLSPRAIARLAELRGQTAYFFKALPSGKHQPVSMEQADSMLVFAYNTSTPAPSPSAEEWCAMTYEERSAHNARVESEMIGERNCDRADPLLIQVVEELGDAASGQCAKLRIVEIPDGVEYQIDEYDGSESVHEKHRSWE